MRLVFEKEKCDNCKACLKGCPAKLERPSSTACLHCRPSEAPCRSACKKGAISENAKGILAIDKEKCDGCGKCKEACPANAIEIFGKKASKCTLCMENSFFLSCVRECAKGAVKTERSTEEKEEAEKTIGWACHKVKGTTLSEGENFALCKENGEPVYCVKMPELSRQEAELIREVRNSFIESSCAKKSAGEFLREYCLKKFIELDEEQGKYLSGILTTLAIGTGPLQHLLEDDSIEEIALTGIGKENPLRIYKRGLGWMKTNLSCTREDEAIKAINVMSSCVGKRITFQKPRLNAILPDGSRINAAISPVSLNGPSFTIRKFRSKPFTPAELARNSTATTEALAFLWMALQSESSFIIAGNTGSGKTTTLNALFSFVPKDERIIIAEETPEINIMHEHKVRLTTNEELGIGMNDLTRETLRMRPDRIVIGEIRSDDEAKAFIDTLLAGQGRGSYATFHAQSAKEAIARLMEKGIAEGDLSAIDLIIVQRRWVNYDLKNGAKEEERRVSEIAEIIGTENGGISLNTLFMYDRAKKHLERAGESLKVAEKIMHSFGIGRLEIEKEIQRRKKFLDEQSACRGQQFKDFFEKASIAGMRRNER